MRTKQHDLTLLPGMSRVIDAMLEDLQRAKRRVWIESYIVRDDRLGRKLVEALTADFGGANSGN